MVLWPSWLLTEKWYVSRPFFLFWTFSVLERANGGWQTWLLIAWDLSAMSTQTKLEKKQEEKNWQGGGRDNNTICTLCSVVLMLWHSYSISEGHCCICLGSENKSEILLLFFLDRSALAGDFFSNCSVTILPLSDYATWCKPILRKAPAVIQPKSPFALK